MSVCRLAVTDAERAAQNTDVQSPKQTRPISLNGRGLKGTAGGLGSSFAEPEAERVEDPSSISAGLTGIATAPYDVGLAGEVSAGRRAVLDVGEGMLKRYKERPERRLSRAKDSAAERDGCQIFCLSEGGIIILLTWTLT